jgi:hypothetical protein
VIPPCGILRGDYQSPLTYFSALRSKVNEFDKTYSVVKVRIDAEICMLGITVPYRLISALTLVSLYELRTHTKLRINLSYIRTNSYFVEINEKQKPLFQAGLLKSKQKLLSFTRLVQKFFEILFSNVLINS